MKTLEQSPWIPYLVIDEETGERKIKEDTPGEIKNKYYEYLDNIECEKQNCNPLAK